MSRKSSSAITLRCDFQWLGKCFILSYTIKNLKSLLLILILATNLAGITVIACAEDKVIAIINNEIITQKDLDDFTHFTYIQLSQNYKDKELGNKVQSMKPDLLNKLIEDKLMLQEAKRENIVIDETRVTAKINEIKSHYLSDAEFQNALIQQGLTQGDLEAKIREQLLIFTLIDSKIKSKIVINPKEVTDFYEQHPQDFIEPESRKTRALITGSEDSAKKIVDHLKAGLDFDTISQDRSIELNNLGLVKKGQLIKEIEDAIFSLGPSGISKPLKFGELYYIFKVDEIFRARKYSLSEIQEEIYNHLFELKMQQNLTQWLEDLKKKSYVEIK